MKKYYETPEVEALGSFESMTQALSAGPLLDATLCDVDPVPVDTFS